ncbi:Ligand-binding domain of nuclear hormone receptor [Oesophagostomum dentatum]|uniref:Ligand-binding domain of nuclear hormone receptor n=1 Tax=Oesophagostomum dentatum TaxID=61180 RepID=A0A0B1T678_OESDE|nr:Ligand-binding domain of nuclear hormone receptor [Oesophagostomum dentatum]
MDRFGAAEGCKYLARMLVNLERTCDNDAFATSTPERYFCNLDITLCEALQNPLLVCERTPLIWKAMKPLEEPQKLSKPMYCRLVLHYLEWLNAVDDFMAFDEIYKVRLTAAHVIPTMLFTMSFNTFKHDSANLLLCNGFFFVEKKSYLEEYGIDVDKLVLELQRTVVQKFRELNVCEEEYVLLKLVILFTNLNTSDEEIADTMRRIRNKYVHLLVQFVKNSQKYPSEKPFDRLQALLQIVGPLISISEIVELHAVQVVALNLAEMRGQLTFDLHVRENL